MHVTVESFAYSQGPAPEGATFVFDSRVIDASVVDGLWQMTGLDKPVADRVLADQHAMELLDQIEACFADLVDGDLIAIGCTEGRHRSVAIAAETARRLRAQGVDVTLVHRELPAARDTSQNIGLTRGSTMVFETRAVGSDALTYTVADGRPRIDARAIKFNSWSVDLGGFRERMMPESVTLEPDLVALFDHDTSRVLGRTSAGTMEVRPNSVGVDFTAYPPDTTWAADLRVSMDRGDIRGCSYRMFVDRDSWYVDGDGQVCRDILAARISELTITSMPAYPETTAEARSHAAAVAKRPVDRAGRVLSDANEVALKAALAAIELAEDTLESVLAAVDPAFQADPEDGCDCEPGCTDPMCTCTDPNCPMCGGSQDSGPIDDGASDMADRSITDGASGHVSRGFATGFGFITSKGK